MGRFAREAAIRPPERGLLVVITNVSPGQSNKSYFLHVPDWPDALIFVFLLRSFWGCVAEVAERIGRGRAGVRNMTGVS